MEKTTYQIPEIRDANDNIIQEGTYGKKSAFCNAQNSGILDYINNNLEALKSSVDSKDTAITSEATTRASADTTLQSNIDTEATTRASADTTLQSNIDTLSSGKANIASPAFTGTPTSPTPATTDNSTKIATTAFVNNACPKRLDITYTEASNVPWQAIANVYSSMTGGVTYIGFIRNASQYTYFGSKTSDAYGSFIVQGYSFAIVYHVYVNNGTWYYQTVTCGTATTFTL